ncbi:hypothetical protein CHS0354_022927 [Potamilus streckersoni]|uniref:MYND-type domain-containing protein n=1 Tax=Potamilus streckersoni TaxID=2493646 RepID=A0AAE0S5Q9_9BIVA|nr:hypothetical protein CHS0354_022927 [Potamilus streckersoni]
MGSRTIEDYVEEIIQYVEDMDRNSKVVEILYTLLRMLYSSKKKHNLNYWRILQCLGEMATDKMVQVLIRNEKHTCNYHINVSLSAVMKLFAYMLSNVAVIKRVLLFWASLGPVVIKVLNYWNQPELILSGLTIIYRIIIVGRATIIDDLVKNEIEKQLYHILRNKHDSKAFRYFSLVTVKYSTKILHGLSVLGTSRVRHQMKHSLALKILADYTAMLNQESSLKTSEVRNDILSSFSEIKLVLSDESTVQSVQTYWNSKIKLRENLENEVDFIFCSSPSCRRLSNGVDKFRYCGACKLSRYCNTQCQKEHWKKGHKKNCLGESCQ